MMTQRGIFTSITRHGINRVNSGPLRKCSFEETTEILLEAAFFGEHDTLTGITENIIFGQLAPYGTGSVDLIVDKEALMGCLDSRPGDDPLHLTSEYTYMNDEEDRNLNMTPTMATPMPYGGASGMTQYGTPNYGDGSFTPTQPQGMFSPGGASSYGDGGQSGYSPMHTQSPAHGITGRDPVYGTPSTPAYVGSPAYGSAYGGQGGDSRIGYSPSGGGQSQHSAYSPTGLGAYQSPSYSPNSPSYNQSMTPIQHSTNNYQYAGANSAGGMPAYTMP